MMGKVVTQELIDFINKQQRNGSYHPHTCCSPPEIKECKRNISYEKRQKGETVEYTSENEGVLTATFDGMECPCGKYIQPYRDGY